MSKRTLPGIAALLLIAALTSSPVPAGTGGTDGTRNLQPLLSPEGALLGSFTDGALGQPTRPPNKIEEAKLALARQAIALAEAAGTRTLLLAERPAPPLTAGQEEELERAKLEHLASQAPPSLARRPGTRPDAGDSPAPPESEVKP